MPTLFYYSCVALLYTDSKTLKEEKREELFENLKAESSLGWEVDIIDPRELSAKMLKRLVYDVETLGTFLTVWTSDPKICCCLMTGKKSILMKYLIVQQWALSGGF